MPAAPAPPHSALPFPPPPSMVGCTEARAAVQPRGLEHIPSWCQLTAEGFAPHCRPHRLPAAPGSRPTPQTAFSSGALWEPRWQERRKEQWRGLGGSRKDGVERAGRAGWAVSRGAAGERRGERQEERARIGRSGREGGRAGEGMRGGGQHRQPRFSCLCCSAGIPAPTSSVFRLERAPVRKGWGREEGCLPAAEVNGSLPGVGRAGNLPRG